MPWASLITPGRWLSRSGWTPSGTTGLGPATHKPWWTAYSRIPLDAMFSTSVSALEFRSTVPSLGVPRARRRRRSADGRVCAPRRVGGRGGEIRGLGPAIRVFDAVIAGQTWHWVDPVAGAAKAADVLRPGGRIAVFWNVFQFPPDLSEAPTSGGHNQFPAGKLEELLAGLGAAIDAVGGKFTMGYATVTITAARTGTI